jgi:hypothetical protein
MTAATLTPIIDADRELRPDWVVIARIMWGEDPQCDPTEAEVRLAVWLLLDQGYTPRQVETHANLEEAHVAGVATLRKFAAQPDRPRGRNGGRNPADARAMGPTRELRAVLAGVRGAVRINEAALVAHLVTDGRRR